MLMCSGESATVMGLKEIGYENVGSSHLVQKRALVKTVKNNRVPS